MEHTFEAAAASYIRQGGEAKYLDPISAYFRGRDVATIAPAEFRDMALALYPEHKASTRNRQAITPARSVMYHAHDLGWCGVVRIRRFRVEKSKLHGPVDGYWLSTFINQCDRDGLHHLAGLVLFMNHTAARVSEAINLRWKDVDLKRRVATLVKTKTGVMQTAYLTDELVFRFFNLEIDPDDRVFSYTSRYAVNDRIKAVCKRAGISYHSSHSVGRYSFATNALGLGLDLKTAMEAGRWKSSVIFLETYVQPEMAGRAVAEKFNSQRYAFMKGL